MIEDDIDGLPDGISNDDIKNFDPYQADRPPREIGFAEETEQIFQHLRSRGDQRIGQYFINAIRSETGATEKEDIEQEIWNLEADRLLNIIESYESEGEKEEENQETECVACGDGVDSADELQEILENKGGE